MRNPKWHRDEIILALDLYFSPDRGIIDDKNPNIIALSKMLNQLPSANNGLGQEEFRSPGSVTFKLSNFLAIDPGYHGKGMSNSSVLDRTVFEEFNNNRDLLKTIAREIRSVINDPYIKQEIQHTEDDEQTNNDSVKEGQTLYKLHKVRERDPKIIKQKKDQALRKYGILVCEVCEFNFESVYGPIGKSFIECHHRIPLASFKTSTITKLDDLALVCSNCHRMLHRYIDTLSIEALKTAMENFKDRTA